MVHTILTSSMSMLMPSQSYCSQVSPPIRMLQVHSLPSMHASRLWGGSGPSGVVTLSHAGAASSTMPSVSNCDVRLKSHDED